MIPFSVLDLSPVPEGANVGQALRNTLDLARHAEALGFHRFWLAEHHNMAGIASAATAVVIGHVAMVTERIRVGSGGIMLPNHAPLIIAEQFGTLAALHPGRIDLGLGRAPGSDQRTAMAIRRNLTAADSFQRDVVELQAYLRPAQPDQAVRAVPGEGEDVPVWLLGSSLFSAQLAAMLGLPFAFASHFAPQLMEEAISLYRHRFEPSAQLQTPYVMLGMNVVAADTQAEAETLFTSLQQQFLRLRQGNPGKLPPPVPPAAMGALQEEMRRYGAEQALACSAVGDPAQVERRITEFVARTGADELMLTAQIHDHAARLRSFSIAAGLRDRIVAARAA